MPKKARALPLLVLALAAPAALLFLKPAAPPPARPKPLCFQTAGEALAFATARILAQPGAAEAGNPYASTYTRAYTTAHGQTTHHFLAHPPERELELAEGFLAHGFGREALVHLENLLTYYADSPQARAARDLRPQALDASVLGLAEPLTVVAQDEDGSRLVAGTRPPLRTPALDRIQDPYLDPALFTGELTVAGFVDDTGNLVITSEGARRELAPPSAPGVVARSRTFFRLPPGARSLWEAEQTAKARLFEKLPETLGPPSRANADPYRRAAQAMIYLGFVQDARGILEKIGEPAASPLTGNLEAIAADATSPLTLDARWLLRVKDNPRLTLSTASAVTSGPELPLRVETHAIDRITFTFEKLEGPFPATENQVRDWFAKAPSKPSHQLTLPVPQPGAPLALPLREPGAFRVKAEARGISCAFLAVRADGPVDLFLLPGETVLHARPELTFSSGNRTLGTTGADGLLSFPGSILSTISSQPIPPETFLRPGEKACAEHAQCCSSCVSCAHHHTVETYGAKVFVSGGGQLFRASVKVDPPKTPVSVPAPAPALLVYTDRPVYKAGDTLRFRGILRVPRQPLSRKDATRLDPAPEREVAVAVRAGDASIFQRTYVTGEFGTFSGECVLPLSAPRGDYVLAVEHEGKRAEQPFEVQDYRKSDFTVVLTPAAGGVRLQAGYAWGAPVAGAELRVTVNGQAVTPQGDFLPARDGDRIRAVLVRAGEEIARKSLTYRSVVRDPSAPPAPAEASAPAEKPAPSAAPGAPEAAPAPPAFLVRPAKPFFGRGEEIVLEIEAPWEEAEAHVILADVQLYDFARVPIRNGRGTARFPARGIHDPGVAAFAVANGRQARADVRVCTQRMAVEITAPARTRPGQEVEVLLRADPEAALSLGAVDEAIYMIREDDTPDLYAHFYPDRPAALTAARFDSFELEGEAHQVERPPRDPAFKDAELLAGRPIRGRGTYDVIGGGAGGGGRYGSRLGGRRSVTARGGGGGATEDAVLSGLRGPSTAQNADGSWSASWASEAGTVTDVGATGLMLLSYLGAGYSHLSKDTYGGVCFGDVVRKGLEWLMSRQDSEGVIGPRRGDWLLNHAIAALALSEAYGLTGSNLFKEQAQKAVDAVAAQQSGNGGWSPAGRGLNGEILTSVFAVMALKSAETAGLTFSATSAANAFRFFDREVDDDGLCGAPPTRANVGGAMLALQFLRGRGDPRRAASAAWLLDHRPAWGQQDVLGWYLLALALFQYDGPSGPAWRAANDALKNTLVRNQDRDGWWTVRGERVCATALGSLTMEVFYRYVNVFGSKGGGDGEPAGLAPAPRVRLHFPDTAFWAPELRTDARGEARVRFTLPDTITTTRLTARGVTKPGAVGHAAGRIAAELPFFVKIRCPEFAVEGDEIEVRTELFNHTKAELEATVVLEGAGAPQALRVPADRPASAAWRVTARDPRGLRLVATARARGHEDAMERTIPVRRPGRERFVTVRGEGETGQAFRFSAPEGVQDLVVKVHPRRGSLAQLLDALRYLNAYPYG
jgi:hypothetical protein